VDPREALGELDLDAEVAGASAACSRDEPLAVVLAADDDAAALLVGPFRELLSIT